MPIHLPLKSFGWISSALPSVKSSFSQMMIMQSCFSVLHYCLIAMLPLKYCLIYTIVQILESTMASFMTNHLLFPSLNYTGGSLSADLALEETGGFGFFCLPIFRSRMGKLNIIPLHQSNYYGPLLWALSYKWFWTMIEHFYNSKWLHLHNSM